MQVVPGGAWPVLAGVRHRDEAAEFAEVMYTMRPDEVKDWLHSLQLRCVSLPDQLKDEAYMLAEG